MVTKKRILIAAGGTGGHFYPGFALAQELRRRGWQALFLVKKEDIARPALEQADFPYAELDMTALPRSMNPLAHAAFLLKLAGATAAAARIIADFKPDAMLGTGSYVAFPAALAARLAGVPGYIHESNAVFGLGNRLAGFFCRRAALGLPMRHNPFAARSVLAGTPIREAFRAVPPREAARAALGLEKGKFTVLVFGGSQGARRLNAAFIAAAKLFKSDIQAVHVTGRRNYEEVRAAYAAAGLDGDGAFKLFDYREDMPALYAAADLVVARSGASTVAELAQLAKPAILVPLPASAGGHQLRNALALSGPGAALCLQESPDFEAALSAAIRTFIGDPGRAAAMAAAYAGTGIPGGLDSSRALAALIEEAV